MVSLFRSSHIQRIVRVTSKSLGYVRWKLKLAFPHTKLIAYQTLVFLKLEHTSPIWSLWQNYLTNDLEAVRSRALRFIYSGYSFYSSINELWIRASILTLCQSWLISHLVLFHNICHQNLFIRGNLLSHTSIVFPCSLENETLLQKI